jgi:hypothetical protein
MTGVTPGHKSKTVATWLALLGGSVGLHRIYLFGWRDRWAWLHGAPALAGLVGIRRMQVLGADDQVAWLLIPWLGLVLAISMGTAIAYGLMPDEKWNARFNPAGRQHQAGWSTVIGVAVSLFVGAGITMATIAYCAQRYFEHAAQHMGSSSP